MNIPNPIPFHPELLLVEETKECVDVLRTMFDALNHEDDAEKIVNALKHFRLSMNYRWYGIEP